MAKVSVIVPCYRQAVFLADALASVRDQTRPADEVLVVAGDAESARLGRELGARVIVAEPRGLADARNVGIEAAAGELVLPLDADDRLSPRFLERTLAALRPQHDIAGTWVQEFGDRGQVWEPHGLERITEANGLPYASLMRRELWADLGGYPIDLIGWEDWGLWLTAKDFGANAVVVPERLLNYRIHAASKSAGERGLEPLWHAMLRIRHRRLYAQRERDLDEVRRAPERVKAEIHRRRAHWPENEWLRTWANLMGIA